MTKHIEGRVSKSVWWYFLDINATSKKAFTQDANAPQTISGTSLHCPRKAIICTLQFATVPSMGASQSFIVTQSCAASKGRKLASDENQIRNH